MKKNYNDEHFKKKYGDIIYFDEYVSKEYPERVEIKYRFDRYLKNGVINGLFYISILIFLVMMYHTFIYEFPRFRNLLIKIEVLLLLLVVCKIITMRFFKITFYKDKVVEEKIMGKKIFGIEKIFVEYMKINIDSRYTRKQMSAVHTLVLIDAYKNRKELIGVHTEYSSDKDVSAIKDICRMITHKFNY